MRFYCAPGVSLPPWAPGIDRLPPSGAVERWADDVPDGLKALPPGGMFYPGGMVWPDQRWVQIDAGRAILADDLTPARLARLSVPRCLRRTPCVEVEGALDGQRWAVPVLLRITPARPIAQVAQVLVRGADGAPAWSLPPGVEALMARLFAAIDQSAKSPDADATAQNVLGLAVDILGLLYHVSLDLLLALQWLDADMLADVIRAAVQDDGHAGAG